MPKISKDKEEKNNIVSSKKTPIKKQTSVEKNIKKEDTVMVEYMYTNEMGIKKKQEFYNSLMQNRIFPAIICYNRTV